MANGKKYYLFWQAYRRSVQSFFAKGLRLEEVYDFSKAKRNNAVIRTLAKLPLYIKYIESEYGIAVLKQTQKKHQHPWNQKRLSA